MVYYVRRKPMCNESHSDDEPTFNCEESGIADLPDFPDALAELIDVEDYTPVEFAEGLDELVQNRGASREEFKGEVKKLVRTARTRGLTEEEIRTQLAAKADAMQAALDGEGNQ